MDRPQDLEQVVGDEPQQSDDGQPVCAADPAPVVFLPLDVQASEAVVLDAPVRPDQLEDVLRFQPTSDQVSGVKPVFEYALGTMLAVAGQHTHQPYLAQMRPTSAACQLLGAP